MLGAGGCGSSCRPRLALARGAVHPRARRDRGPPCLRDHAGAPENAVRAGHRLELSGAEPEAVEAFPRTYRDSLHGPSVAIPARVSANPESRRRCIDAAAAAGFPACGCAAPRNDGRWGDAPRGPPALCARERCSILPARRMPCRGVSWPLRYPTSVDQWLTFHAMTLPSLRRDRHPACRDQFRQQRAGAAASVGRGAAGRASALARELAKRPGACRSPMSPSTPPASHRCGQGRAVGHLLSRGRSRARRRHRLHRALCGDRGQLHRAEGFQAADGR